jgi:uncharacterized LabA/DUF88 family protein
VGKNVAVFVDVANIFYAAKAAGVDIDYVTLLKSAVSGRDFVRAYAYTGLDPENENQRNFHSFLSRHGYKVVSKDIRKYGDGKVKANLDIELVVDMMKTARNLDVAIVVSGDGDFAPAIRAVQEMGVRVEVISFRGNTSSDLIDVADIFTDITQVARVEKGSSRSGRRVAGDEEDLSMTEVPDKQTEGTGRGRTRGGRGRGRAEPEPVAAGGRRRRAVAEDADDAGGPSLTVLPGEKLSRARSADDDAVTAVPVAGESPEDTGADRGELGGDDEARRRRRRRGGRGRGRGRGRAGEGVGEGIGEGIPVIEAVEELPEEDIAPRRPPRAAAFGSVWDTQIGTPRQPSELTPLPSSALDEEFDDEPAIPEYLIAERRGQNRQPGRGPGRGPRSGYSAAVDRERYGRGGGGGINRYPDVSGRVGTGAGRGGSRDQGRRDDRGGGYGRGGDRPPRIDRTGGAPRPGEQWSEVPPELEAMLRAQLAARGPASAPPRGRRPETTSNGRSATAAGALSETAPATESTAGETTTTSRGRTTRGGARSSTTGRARRSTSDTGAAAPNGAATPGGEAASDAGVATAPARRGRRPAAAITEPAGVAPATAGTSRGRRATTTSPAAEAGGAAAPSTRRRTTRTSAPAGEAASESGSASSGTARRTTRARTTATENADGGEAAATPRRRTTRRTPDQES